MSLSIKTSGESIGRIQDIFTQLRRTESRLITQMRNPDVAVSEQPNAKQQTTQAPMHRYFGSWSTCAHGTLHALRVTSSNTRERRGGHIKQQG